RGEGFQFWVLNFGVGKVGELGGSRESFEFWGGEGGEREGDRNSLGGGQAEQLQKTKLLPIQFTPTASVGLGADQRKFTYAESSRRIDVFERRV
ncbi:MAG TPA: hypothetical protein VLS96_08500, partial [Nodosilinea sp.]|nr:hypothetical protein [Nodosilinea sp.]